MDSTRYVQIPCGVCGGKNLAIGGEPRPADCVHCKAPLGGRPPVGARSRVRPSDPATHAPATFARGTFRHSAASAQKVSPSKSLKAPHEAGGLKDKLLRLFAHRS